MPFSIVRNDITKMKVDAIVNAANESLLGGGGVDGAIHRAAGPGLLAECRTLGGCPAGQAKITGGYRLPCRYVIHTVGPVWRGGGQGERQLLQAAYRNSLELAARYHCETVAFPLISAGAYGYPREEALQVAADTIRDFLQDHDMGVILVIFDRESYRIGGQRYADIAAYIDDRYADAHTEPREEQRRRALLSGMPLAPAPDVYESSAPDFSAPGEQTTAKSDFPLPAAPAPARPPFGRPPKPGKKPAAAPAPEVFAAPTAPKAPFWNRGLRDAVAMLDESFSQMLLRKIDEKGMTDAQCYKKANIDRKLFSKIRSDVHYKPSKATAMAFAVALELPLEEARELLQKAGYAFSHASKFDIIVEYFIAHGDYDIFAINEALFAFDQCLLGG